MKNYPAIKNLLENNEAVMALPEVIAEWNMNRYIDTTVDNTPSEDTDGYQIEYFPIESIVDPIRPTKGVSKARIGMGTVASDSIPIVVAPRYYVADVDDQYKYWTSPVASDASGNITKCSPQVIYSESVPVNKIVITTENTWASMATYSVQITTDGTTWTTIATQASAGTAWQVSGQLVLYYNGTSWVTTGRVDNADKSPKYVDILGVKLVVTKLSGGVLKDGSSTQYLKQTSNGTLSWQTTTGANSHFDLIELSARLEADLSDYTISTSDTFELSDVSNLYPVGRLTSNQGSVTLSNIFTNADGEQAVGAFSKETDDPAIPWSRFIDMNVKINLRYLYYTTDGTYVDAVQQFVMYADSWSGQSDEQVEVDLTDHSKFFNDTTPNPALWENLTIPDIVRRILDSVGFTSYTIHQDATKVAEHKIPVFYINGDDTLWEVLDSIAEASQTAIYFDAYGMLQIATRNFAFRDSEPADYVLQSYDTSTRLANIETLDMDTEFEPNYFDISYQTTKWTAYNNGSPTLQQVWQPDDDTVVLRATPLVQTMHTDSYFIWIDDKEVSSWPYKGMVNIQGELIAYEGKQYIYYTGTNGGTKNQTVVKSADEKNTKNAQTPAQYRYKNHFTGALKITERGVWNSVPREHVLDINGYTTRHVTSGNQLWGAPGLSLLRSESKAYLQSGSRFKTYKDILISTRGAETDTTFKFYGTKMVFVKGAGRTQQSGGLALNTHGTTDGYYIEFRPTNKIAPASRKIRNELIVYSRIGGVDYRIGGLGRSLAIVEGVEFEVDATVVVNPGSGSHKIQVWVNGTSVFSEYVPAAHQNEPNGRFGMFLRGKSAVKFEYLYGIAREDPEMEEDFSFLDKVARGYTGNQWDREFVYKWRTESRRVKKKWVKEQVRWSQQFFDEFGPIVHEIREFDVDFDPNPTLHSQLYLTNDWSAVCLEYSPTPYGAKFYIANTARENAVIHGEDNLSFAGSSSGGVNQVLNVLGRVLVIDDAESVIAKNDSQIRRRGKIDSDLSNNWLQSKAMAQDIADWMNDNWSYGNDTLNIDIFGNPLIEVGDVVTVDYPEKNIYGDYFVVSTDTDFDEGMSTKLVVRRRITPA